MKKTVLQSKNDKDSDDDGEFDELFPSDLSDDEDDENRFLLKEERDVKKSKVHDDSVKKSTKKVQAEQSKIKLKTKSEKAPTVDAPTPEEDEIADGEDIADEVIDFDMSEEESEEENNDEDD